MICNYLKKTLSTVAVCVVLWALCCSSAPNTRRSAATANCSTNYQPASAAVQLANGFEVAEHFTVSSVHTTDSDSYYSREKNSPIKTIGPPMNPIYMCPFSYFSDKMRVFLHFRKLCLPLGTRHSTQH